jgi:N-acyl-D-amino-acid deacylase
MLRHIVLYSIAVCLSAAGHVARAVEPAGLPDADRTAAAVSRGLALVERAAANYPTHRDCFSCHHQTLPMFAMVSVRGEQDRAADTALRAQAEFTHKSFQSKQASMLEGRGIGGRSMTVGYGLWAFELADRPADEVTEAMVTYLLKNQEREGYWKTTSNRPPLEESDITCTVLAVAGLRKYAADAQRAEVDEKIAKARDWLATAPVESNEDRVFKLWGVYQFEAAAEQIEAARAAVLAAQRTDGGWSQLESMESDAYATGQALYILRVTGLQPDEASSQRGVEFLLKSQEDDGSWLVETRSNPIQVYFDNGDPHGKHQFISTPATAWAIAALSGERNYKKDREQE